MGAGLWAVTGALGVGAGSADESARAAERVDKDTKAATPSAMAEVRGTL